MRLICPNCGATYEVDANLIPAAGRDVQCSNCGHGWFQHPDTLDDEAEDTVEAVETEETVEATLVEGEIVEDETFDEDEAFDEDDEGFDEDEDADEDEFDEEDEYDEDYEDDEPVTADVASSRRRPLETGVADILREEAEREAAARRAEAAAEMESQPDLGLQDTEKPKGGATAAALARMARMRNREETTAETEPQATRKELLPDVEEINSTLRGQQERGEIPDLYEEEEEAQERRKSFRSGFLLVVLVCAIAVAVYALAPRIAAAVPALDPYLRAYVDWVNMARGQLNGLIQSLADKVSALSNSIGS